MQICIVLLFEMKIFIQFPGLTEYTTQKLLWFSRVPLKNPINFQLNDSEEFWNCESVNYAYRNKKSHCNQDESAITLVNNGIEAIRNDIKFASETLCRGFSPPHLYDGAFYTPKGISGISFSVYIERKSNKRFLLASLYL